MMRPSVWKILWRDLVTWIAVTTVIVMIFGQGAPTGQSLARGAAWCFIYLSAAFVPVMIYHLACDAFRRRDFPPGFCRHCGYNLTGNLSGVCPECGRKVAPMKEHE